MSRQRSNIAVSRQAICKNCGIHFKVRGQNRGLYCSNQCRAGWLYPDKPIDLDWLHQKYVVEQLDCVAIGKIVNRDPKTIWAWLKRFGFETRPRGTGHENNPAFAFWAHGGESPFKGYKWSEEAKKKASERCKAEGRVPYDPAVGSYMKGRKGAEVPSWKGGITPERQAFYSSPEWKAVVPLVWKRDNATCQRCGARNSVGVRLKFAIHHIVTFQCRELRAELSNLILLCRDCHLWVHSLENVDHEFIKEIPECYLNKASSGELSTAIV